MIQLFDLTISFSEYRDPIALRVSTFWVFLLTMIFEAKCIILFSSFYPHHEPTYDDKGKFKE